LQPNPSEINSLHDEKIVCDFIFDKHEKFHNASVIFDVSDSNMMKRKEEKEEERIGTLFGLSLKETC